LKNEARLESQWADYDAYLKKELGSEHVLPWEHGFTTEDTSPPQRTQRTQRSLFRFVEFEELWASAAVIWLMHL
jgi:hypothetical protein